MTNFPKILIVDYDPRALKTLEDMFAESGYQTSVAKDGIAAIASFKEFKPDLILLEAMIPKKHGFEVCQEIKRTPEGKAVPILITTAVYKGRKYRTQAMHVHGCDEYIEKPCPPEQILEMVKRFVPPGRVKRAVAAVAGGQAASQASGNEKRGEVIPFPAGRSGHPGSALDDDAEAEIMSRLDQILPDTPLFDERGLNFSAGSALAEDPATADDGDLEAGTMVLDDADTDPKDTDPRESTSAPNDAPSDKASKAKRRAAAMGSDEVMKMTRSRKKPAKTTKDDEQKKPMISARYIVGLVLAIIIVLFSVLIGKV